MGLNLPNHGSKFKQLRADKPGKAMEDHDSMDALDAVGNRQLSYNADTESESNSSSTCCSSSSSTKTVSLVDRLRAPTPSTLARKRKIGVNSAPPKGKKRASRQALRAAYVPHRPSELLNFLANNWLYQRESSFAELARRLSA